MFSLVFSVFPSSSNSLQQVLKRKKLISLRNFQNIWNQKHAAVIEILLNPVGSLCVVVFLTHTCLGQDSFKKEICHFNGTILVK